MCLIIFVYELFHLPGSPFYISLFFLMLIFFVSFHLLLPYSLCHVQKGFDFIWWYNKVNKCVYFQCKTNVEGDFTRIRQTKPNTFCWIFLSGVWLSLCEKEETQMGKTQMCLKDIKKKQWNKTHVLKNCIPLILLKGIISGDIT